MAENSFTISGQFVFPDRIFRGTVTVKNGVITGLQESDARADYVFAEDSQYILPGLIEVHGHMREPGLETKGDIPHETRAALAGGVTTIIDMPNTNPPTTTRALLEEKKEKLYPGRSFTDYAFFIGVSKEHLVELEAIDTNDVVGIKVFMAGHETTPTTVPDDATLSKVFEIAAKRGLLLAVHAEDQWLINYYMNKFQLDGETSPALWSQIRPKEVIVSAVARAITLAAVYRTKLYLLHLSTPEEFALVDAAKAQGVDVHGELVGYQLVFTTDDYEKLGNLIKVAPALRTKEDQLATWQRFLAGGIDVVCSEHTPHEWESKNQPDVFKAQSGTPGIQETLPALLTAFSKRFPEESFETCLKRIVAYGSLNPAMIFGFNQKGSITIGKDADFVIVDTSAHWSVSKQDLYSKCGWSAYEGMQLVGRPIATYLRGALVYKNGKIVGEPSGTFVDHTP